MSTISINLLPEIRLKKLQAQKQRQLSLSAMFAVLAVCGGLIVLGVIVTQAQNLRISVLSKSIDDSQNTIDGIPDVKVILTTQNHLAGLGSLYSSRVNLSKFFAVLQTISPKEVSIKSLSLGEGNTITISGVSNSYLTASRLARAMETSGLSTDPGQSAGGKADFSDVQLSGLASDQAGKVNFSIKATTTVGVSNASK